MNPEYRDVRELRAALGINAAAGAAVNAAALLEMLDAAPRRDGGQAARLAGDDPHGSVSLDESTHELTVTCKCGVSETVGAGGHAAARTWWEAHRDTAGHSTLDPSAAHVGQRDGGAAGDEGPYYELQSIHRHVGDLEREVFGDAVAAGLPRTIAMGRVRRLVDYLRPAAPRAGADTAATNCRGRDCGRDDCATCSAMAAYYEQLNADPPTDSVPRAAVEALLAALDDIDAHRPQTVDMDTAVAEVRRHLDGGIG